MDPRTKIATRIILTGMMVAAFLTAYSTIAQTPSIQYPVAELGNCVDEPACRAFCDNPGNITPCVAFAERHKLISAEEAAQARKFVAIGAVGPGGCQSKEACETFCEDVTNIEVCLDFGERNGFLTGKELEEAKKVAQVLRQGGSTPGGCRGKSQCEAYCNDTAHIQECIAFAEQSGILPPEELAEARKVADALAKGARLPGGCRGKAQCEAYCQDPNNIEECFAFAEATGFIPPEEIEQARKVLPLMARGETPGGCRGRGECEAYCQDEAHLNECVEFASKAGLMKPEEVEMFKKTGGKGPGGCKGREECESYCNSPANQEACFNFATEHNLIPQEQIQQAREGLQQLREGLSQAPPEVATCLQSQLGTENFQKIQGGTLTPGPQIGDQVRKCFEEAFQGGEHPGGPGGPPGGFPGQPPEGFPGHPGEFPGQPPEGFPGGFPGGQIPEGFRPPEGSFPTGGEHPSFEGIGPIPGTPGIFQPSNQPIVPEGFHTPEGSSPPPGGSYEQQYQQQFQQQYQQQQQHQEQQQSPSGSFPPPPEGSFTPPPSGTVEPQPHPPPPSSSRAPRKSFLANFLEVLR